MLLFSVLSEQEPPVLLSLSPSVMVFVSRYALSGFHHLIGCRGQSCCLCRGRACCRLLCTSAQIFFRNNEHAGHSLHSWRRGVPGKERRVFREAREARAWALSLTEKSISDGNTGRSPETRLQTATADILKDEALAWHLARHVTLIAMLRYKWNGVLILCVRQEGWGLSLIDASKVLKKEREGQWRCCVVKVRL